MQSDSGVGYPTGGAYSGNSDGFYSGTTGAATPGISVSTTGSSGTNANLQPYVVAYVWKRTA